MTLVVRQLHDPKPSTRIYSAIGNRTKPLLIDPVCEQARREAASPRDSA